MTITGLVSCLCKGTDHDPDCWTLKPPHTYVIEPPVSVSHPLCSCGTRGLHSLPIHVWKRWFPNSSWLRSTWGDRS